MDKEFKSLLVYFMALVLLSMASCTDETTDDLANLEIGDYESEQFNDLTIEEFSALETPMEALLSAVTSGGRKLGTDIDELTSAILEVLEGAKKIEITESEERGLPVYEIELLLASGGTLEVVIVKDIFEILEIEGQSGLFDYDIDPQGSFLALSEALLLAKDSLNGEIVRWELELEEDNRWEFEVHVETSLGKFEVEIDAFSGEILDINKIEEEDEDDFEEEDEQVPDNVLEAIGWYIEADLIQASSYQEKEVNYWNLYVKTSSGALVKLVITEDTEDLIDARDEDGPYDYNLTPGENFISLNEAIEIAQDAFDGEVYYWYFEEIWHQEAGHWAYVVKIDNGQNELYKFGIDATTGDILFEEFFD
ncbi:MAG: PepSY domain-containing protein [Reichenbachiella sp.]|uniref:PepSY domain-containing protein n=1 Tax=Reichenbachiella sp. TaxID=2184521 RepID=UPI0032651CFF